MANKQFIVKHGMDVKRTDGTSSLSIASDTGALTMGQALSTTSTIESGAKLTVAAGGADINGMLDAKGGLNVTGGHLVVTGNLTVNGTTSTVNSTTVTIDDPIFTLGGDTDPTSDDNKDRGIEFRYFDGSAKRGFMGYDDSSGKFRFLTNATNTAEVFTGTDATLVAAIEGNASTASALAGAGTLSLTAGDIVAVSDSSDIGTYSLAVTIDSNKVTFAKMQQLTSMKVMGNVTGGTANAAEVSILDEDAMGSNSATALATQQSIKAYVDSQLSSSNSIAEMTDTDISGIGQAHVLVWDNDDGEWQNQAMSGDVTMTKEGVTTIGALSVENGMLANKSLTVTAGDGLSGGGSVELGATVSLAVTTDNSSIETNSDALRVKAGGITNAMLAGSIADGNLAEDYIKTSEVDGSSIEFAGGSLNVKDDGITDAHINWGAGAGKVSTADVPEETNLYFTNARVYAATAVSAAGDVAIANNATDLASLSYSNGTFTFASADAADIKGLFSASAAGDLSPSADGDDIATLTYSDGVYTFASADVGGIRDLFSAAANDGLTYTDATGAFALAQDIQSTATPTFAGVTITGNLTIAGTTTTVNSATMEVEDSLFLLAKNNAANATDIGFAAAFKPDGEDQQYAALFRDASSNKWRLIKTKQANISTTNVIDTTAAGYAVESLVANLEGAVTGNADTATTLANTRTFEITGGGITAAAQNFNGSANVTLSASIDANAVTLAKMAQLASMKVIGNVT